MDRTTKTQRPPCQPTRVPRRGLRDFCSITLKLILTRLSLVPLKFCCTNSSIQAALSCPRIFAKSPPIKKKVGRQVGVERTIKQTRLIPSLLCSRRYSTKGNKQFRLWSEAAARPPESFTPTLRQAIDKAVPTHSTRFLGLVPKPVRRRRNSFR